MDSSAADRWGSWAAEHPNEAAPAMAVMGAALAMSLAGGTAIEIYGALAGGVEAIGATAATLSISSEADCLPRGWRNFKKLCSEVLCHVGVIRISADYASSGCANGK